MTAVALTYDSPCEVKSFLRTETGFLKCLLPASSRVQGTEETLDKCLRDDRGGWEERSRKGDSEEGSIVSERS